MEKISYWVDHNDVIIKVSDSWDSNMDLESWSERASGKTIIGRSLFDFVCDDTTRMYITSILDHVRLIPQSAFRYYRCDTPKMKRNMRMIVSPEQDGSIRFSHELISSSPLIKKVTFSTVKKERSAAISLPEHTGLPEQNHYVRCSLCNQISKDGYSDWEDADFLSDTRFIDLAIPVSYGICQDCLRGAKWTSKPVMEKFTS